MTNTATLAILVVGREKAILEVVERLINSHEGWKATIVNTEDDAVEAFRRQPFPIVLVCAGLSVQEEEALRRRLVAEDPDSVVIRHYGGGSGLLENEILGILDQKRKNGK
jgi:DNA-binding response OmpR family regulator